MGGAGGREVSCRALQQRSGITVERTMVNRLSGGSGASPETIPEAVAGQGRVSEMEAIRRR